MKSKELSLRLLTKNETGSPVNITLMLKQTDKATMECLQDKSPIGPDWPRQSPHVNPRRSGERPDDFSSQILLMQSDLRASDKKKV